MSPAQQVNIRDPANSLISADCTIYYPDINDKNSKGKVRFASKNMTRLEVERAILVFQDILATCPDFK